MATDDDSAAARAPGPAGSRHSLRTRLIWRFAALFTAVHVLLTVAHFTGVPFFSYPGMIQMHEDEALRDVQLIADLKKTRLLQWIEDRRDDAYAFAGNDLVEVMSVSLLDRARELRGEGVSGEGLRRTLQTDRNFRGLREFLDSIREAYGTYTRILIADAKTGDICVSTRDADVGGNIGEHPALVGALRTGKDYMSDVTLVNGDPVFTFSHVVQDIDTETLVEIEDRVIAVLLLEVNADAVLRPILHTGEGLGKKGEALLVDQRAYAITTLLHPLPDGRTPKPLEHRIEAAPAAAAARGKEGMVQTTDYRGEEVLAAYRHIRVTPDWGWGLVVKRDWAEVVLPLRREIIYFLATGLIGIGAIIVLTVIIGRSLTRPIVSLSRTAERVAAGRLDARAPIVANDEVRAAGGDLQRHGGKGAELARRARAGGAVAHGGAV